MLLVPALVALTAPFAAADWVWEPESGWRDMSQAAADSDRAIYGYARGLFVRGDWAAAAEVFAELEKRFPDSPLAPKAKFERARCEERLGHPRRSIAICKELLVEAAEGEGRERIASFLLELFEGISKTSPLDTAHELWFVGDHAPVPALRRAAYFSAGEAFFEAGDYDMARLAPRRQAQKKRARRVPITSGSTLRQQPARDGPRSAFPTDITVSPAWPGGCSAPRRFDHI